MVTWPSRTPSGVTRVWPSKANGVSRWTLNFAVTAISHLLSTEECGEGGRICPQKQSAPSVCPPGALLSSSAKTKREDQHTRRIGSRNALPEGPGSLLLHERDREIPGSPLLRGGRDGSGGARGQPHDRPAGQARARALGPRDPRHPSQVPQDRLLSPACYTTPFGRKQENP